MLIGASCQSGGQGDDPFVVADLFATPGKALATVALSATPVPSATEPNVPTNTPAPTLPLPTVVILQQPTLPIGISDGNTTPTRAVTPTPLSCENPPEMPFTPIWQNITEAQALMRCPIGQIQEFPGVYQGFEHGIMFWRELDKSIYIISELAIRQGQETDHWWRVDDTWTDGEPESDPGLQAPGGLRQPVRGFGKVWRGNAFIREALGWATTDEIGMATLWMEFEGGWMMTGPNQAPIYVLVPEENQSPPYSSGTHLGPMP